MDNNQSSNKSEIIWEKFGSVFYLVIRIMNSDGSENYNATFRFYCVHEKDAIDSGINILEQDGLSLRKFLDNLEKASNTLKQNGILLVDSLSEDTIRGHTSSKSEFLKIILEDIKTIQERFEESQLENYTIVIDKTNYFPISK